ncbi:MAG TPA: PAS domain-containing protein, partial [Polyangiales bacterium]|nr:PAS domain-containing protein [Polyangiales bacterium]
MSAHVSESLVLSSLLAASSDSVVAFDLAGTILAWNPAAEARFGVGASEAIGQSLPRFFAKSQTLIEAARTASS